MEKIEHLLQVYSNRIGEEKLVFEKIKNPENKYHFIPNLKGTNEFLALYHMYVKHDFAKARSCFYKAARISEFMTLTYDWRIMDTGVYNLTNALFSDDINIIERFCTIRNQTNSDSVPGYQVADAAHNVFLGDNEKLSWNINQIERFLKLPRFQSILGILNYFNGFKNNDEQQIKKGLQDLLASRKKRNIDPLFSKFFSIDTAGYTKLAWLKGYEIDLQSAFVPVELMRIEPLDYYEDYDFLKL